jgi:hypothetical protein
MGPVAVVALIVKSGALDAMGDLGLVTRNKANKCLFGYAGNIPCPGVSTFCGSYFFFAAWTIGQTGP